MYDSDTDSTAFYDANEDKSESNLTPTQKLHNTLKPPLSSLSMDYFNSNHDSTKISDVKEDDPIARSSSLTEEEIEIAKYRVVDKDTGKVMDIRELENNDCFKFKTFENEILQINQDSGDSDTSDTATQISSQSNSTTTSIFNMFKGISKNASNERNKSFSIAQSQSQPTSHEFVDTSTSHIKMHLTHKDETEFEGLKLSQTIHVHSGPIWTAKFSCDGCYLGTAGQDGKVIVWQIGQAAEEEKEAMDDQTSEFNSEMLKKDSDSSNDSCHSIPSESVLWPNKSTANVSSKNNNNNNNNNNRNNSGTNVLADKTATATITTTRPPPFQLINITPYKTFLAHTADVIDIAWSCSNFLLSASLDKTVRLWHVTRDDCLQIFRHADFVTSVDFHPSQDRFFVSGCFDKKIRVWDIIPDGHVTSWVQTPEMITATSFSPDGKMIAAGLYHGQVFFYEFEGMRYYTQIECRNRHGQNSAGKKVTGLSFFKPRRIRSSNNLSQKTTSLNDRKSVQFSDVATQLLVTTNDSRLRVFSIDNYSLVNKYKGAINKSMQIKASFSDFGKYIISGSENGNVFIWNTQSASSETNLQALHLSPFTSKSKKDHIKSCESFDCNIGSTQGTVATVAIFVPINAIEIAMEMNQFYTVTHTAEEGLESKLIVTADYAGNIKVFVRGYFPEKLS